MYIFLENKKNDFFLPEDEYLELSFEDPFGYLDIEVSIRNRYQLESETDDDKDIIYNTEDDADMFEKCDNNYIFKYKPQMDELCVGDYPIHIYGIDEDGCRERITEAVMTLRHQ